MKINYRIAILTLCVLSVWTSRCSEARRGNQAIEIDVNNLYSVNAEVRTHAAERLVAIGSSVIPSLIPVICDKSKPNFDRAWPMAAKVLGQLKAEGAAPCLVMLLAWNFPPIGPAFMKPDETILQVDPAFAALVQIGGEPVVHTLRREIQFLHPEGAYVGLRVLRILKTPSAKEAVNEYIKALQEQIRLANTVLEVWDK
jgi:HEAT repeat protein